MNKEFEVFFDVSGKKLKRIVFAKDIFDAEKLVKESIRIDKTVEITPIAKKNRDLIKQFEITLNWFENMFCGKSKIK